MYVFGSDPFLHGTFAVVVVKWKEGGSFHQVSVVRKRKKAKKRSAAFATDLFMRELSSFAPSFPMDYLF